MKINIHKEIIDIESEDIFYSNLKNLYKIGHGVGLQISPDVHKNRDKILKLCNNICDNIYELNDLLNNSGENNE